MRSVRLAIAAAALGVLLSAQPVSAASPARIEGTVRGLPALDGSASPVVLAVRATDGIVLAADLVERGARYRLKVRPGPYLIVATAAGRDGRTLQGISRLVVARSGKTVRSDLRVAATGARIVPRTPSATPPDVPAPRAAAEPIVVEITDTLTDRALAAVVVSQLLGPFAAGGVELSHRQRSVVDSLRYWAKQSDQGRTEVRYQYRPRAARFYMSGSITSSPDGTARVHLGLLDRKTNVLLVDHATPGARGPLGDYKDLYVQAADEFAPLALERIRQATAPGADVEVSVRLFVRGPGRAPLGSVMARGPGLTVTSARVEQELFSVPVGTTITITAFPGPGNIFAGWHAARCGWPYGNTEVAGVHGERPTSWTCTITAPNPPVPGQGHGQFVIVADAFFCDPENTPAGLCASLPRR